MTFPEVNTNRIKEIRKNKGISIEQMSNRMGFNSYQGYYKKEVGLRQFSANDISKICLILNVKYEDIFFTPKVTEKETN
ncbi:helix-turn-helix transcriptional regulator [Mammaliicoccus fleurettii]|uniref:helix-turn-helix transcriptional regulator n=1 Tax=Mammaliicoccus fleurettii TaxID=150056 RepID=UPI002DB77751|nr:helix-turn-helix transcriptional regulator [Mammaliicoccus fleurettii]MEB7723436.1 helix-turn-helix domain-containing protein [Mammaliicoccus fleurettii]